MTDEISGKQVAVLGEILQDEAGNLARGLMKYKETLIEIGFEPGEALLLTQGVQRLILDIEIANRQGGLGSERRRGWEWPGRGDPAPTRE
jgi:hypothetical protein